MKAHEVTTKLESLKEKLELILSSDLPTDPQLHGAHHRKVKSAKEYLKEVEVLLTLIPGSRIETFIVPLSTFNRKLETADFASIEDEGLFFRLASINNFPFENISLLYLFPISSL